MPKVFRKLVLPLCPLGGQWVMFALMRRALTLYLLFGLALVAHSTEAVPLAIQGFDPVAYFTRSMATPGLASLEYEWDERRYRFASPAHLELFKADPVRYAPQFANYCAVALARGEFTAANPQYWLISEGKLYLFGKSVGPELFARDAARLLENARKTYGTSRSP
jgi:hypothetical protein